MAGDTTSSFARTEANKFYSPKWLGFASKNLVFQKYGRVERMPQKVGSVIRFKLQTGPTVTTAVPLTEGVTPDPVNLARTEVRADVVEFGNWLQETNRMRDLFEDAENLNELQQNDLGTRMREERDIATFDIISIGTTVQYTNGSARSSVNTVWDYNDLQLASRTLKKGSSGRAGKPLKKMLRTDGRFGTVSIEPSFVVIIAPDQEYDVRQMEGFSSVSDYGSTSKLDDGEFGKVENFRFICTTVSSMIKADSGGTASGKNVITTTGTSADVYLSLIISEDAYATIALAGKEGSALIRKTLGSSGTEDPLDQRGSVGYCNYFAGCILYQERLLRMETAATLTPGA